MPGLVPPSPQHKVYREALICSTDRRSLRQPELEKTLRRTKNPLTIRRTKGNTISGDPAKGMVEEELLDLSSIRTKAKALLASGDLKSLALYVACILKVILKSDSDKDGTVYILPRELAIKRAIRAVTKVVLALVLRVLHALVVLSLSWTLNFSMLSFFWFANARHLLIYAVIHFLTFSAMIDFTMAAFGWAIVREEGPDGSSSERVHYHIAEAFYDPYFSTSLADFWGRRYTPGYSTLTTFIPSVLTARTTSPRSAEAAAVQRVVTGLPFYLLVLGALDCLIYLFIEHRLRFSVLLFYCLHAAITLLETIVAEMDMLAVARSSTASPSELLILIGQQLKRARDMLFPAANVRKYAGMAFFWVVLYFTLPLYFADDHPSR